MSPTSPARAQNYGTAHATNEDEQDKLVDDFVHELSGDPPGERSIIPQLLGWTYLVTAIALAIITMRHAAASLTLDWPLIRNAVAITLHTAIGIAVDADKDWALWPGIALSAATVFFTATPALNGDPIAAFAALAHVALLVGLPIDRLTRGPPKRPA